MRAAVPLRRAAALAAVASLAAAGLAAAPATADSARPAVTTAPGAPAGQPQRGNRSNVGATHSPQLLRQLAGPAGGGHATPGPTAPPAITGAIAGAAQGVDIASYQHPGGAAINWADAAAAGIRFAAVKATEGTYYQNPYALTDLAQAQAAGLAVGAYAFAIPNGNGGRSSPVAQADYLLSYLGADSSNVPIMLDIEDDPYVSTDGTNQCYGLSQAAMVAWISAFDAVIHRDTGRLPIIYTPASWWSACTGGSTGFSQLPLWIPDYTTASSPALPDGWDSWSIWQYTSVGTVSGIDDAGHTDLDQLNPAVIGLLDPGKQQGVAGRPVDWRLKQADPVPGQVPSFSASGLPAGVSVSAGGLVNGWPDSPGTYPVTVTATDSQGAAGSVSFTWTVSSAADTGPAGHVRLHKDGKCLHDAGNAAANGTAVNIWHCRSGAAQQWTAVKDDTVRIHGKCLAVYQSGTAGGTPVVLHSCNGSDAQQWRAGTDGRLVNPASGKCLADPAGSTRNGKQAQIRSCTGHASQKWTLPAGPVTSQLPRKCLDDSKNGTASGTPVDLQTCNGGSAQAWRARPGGTLRIHSKCLAATDSGGGSGTTVDLRTCDGARAQQWRIIADQAGESVLNRASGLCLADPGDATANGTRLEVVTCSATDPGMIWRVR
jgi:GH25 family lysozyme M1 (1,4-beta-N-acetylmuramidase)